MDMEIQLISSFMSIPAVRTCMHFRGNRTSDLTICFTSMVARAGEQPAEPKEVQFRFTLQEKCLYDCKYLFQICVLQYQWSSYTQTQEILQCVVIRTMYVTVVIQEILIERAKKVLVCMSIYVTEIAHVWHNLINFVGTKKYLYLLTSSRYRAM